MKHSPRYQPGDRIGGRYQVHQVKMGGMGEVYLCLDLETIRPYALKTFQQRHLTYAQHLRQAFEKEVAIWVALEKHPNIVRCFWMETFDNQPFMVLEWVAGKEGRGADLRSWLRRGPLDLKLALEIAIDICRGLSYAQVKQPGLVHRDLKPGNILITQGSQAKVTDFGLAQIVQETGLMLAVAPGESDERRSMVTGQGIVGTPVYMAPEQWRGEPLDERTDIYAIGCILYEMIAGKPPFQVDVVPMPQQRQQWLSTLQAQHENAPVPIPSTHIPTVLNDLLTGCLAKSPAERARSLTELLPQLICLYREAYDQAPPDRPVTGQFTAVDYNNRGKTYADLQKSEQALADFNRAVELDPRYTQAYSNRGAIYAALRQYKQALADYNRAIALDPNDALTYSNRGGAYVALQQPKQALADFNRAVELDSNLALAYYNRGVLYADLQQPEQALADYNRAIELDPNYSLAYSSRGKTYADLQQSEQALADFNRAIELDSNFALAYSNRGAIYAALQQYKQALADYNRAIALDPHDAPTYSNRGNTYQELQQMEQALADHSRAIALDPNYAPAYSNRGLTYAMLRQYKQALADYNRAIELDPNFAPAYLNRGNIYDDLQQPEHALIDFSRATELDPNDVRSYFNLGALFANMGRLHESLHYFEKAAHLNDLQAKQAAVEVRHMLGMQPMPAEPSQQALDAFEQGSSHAALHQYEQALLDYSRAITLDPFFSEAYYNRGVLYADLQQPEQALADYNRAIDLNSGFAQAYSNRGVLYADLQQPEQALADYNRAIELNSDFAQAYSNRGVLYADLQQPEQALADYNRAIELDPSNAQSYVNLGALLGNQGQHRDALPYFEKAAQLGHAQGAQYVAQARQMLGMEAPPQVDLTQLAFTAFQQADSSAAMRQAVTTYPILKEADFVAAIEQVIARQVPPAQRPYFKQRLAWLRQVVHDQQ